MQRDHCNGLFAQMMPNGADWYKSTNIFPFGGSITAVGRKRYIWIILLSIEGGCGSESQHGIVAPPRHINIWVGGPLLSLLWPPLSSYIPCAGGAALQSALGHPEGCMVGSTCHWRVITQTPANASFSRSQSSTANSQSQSIQDPLKISGSAVTRGHHHVYLLSNDMGCSLLHRLVTP